MDSTPASTDAAPATPDPRRSPLAWRIGATVAFGTMLAGLLALGLWARFAPVRRPLGLPDDPEVRAAREMLAGGLPLAVPDLAMETTLAGGVRRVDSEAVPLDRLAAARARLAAAAARRPGDVRVTAALAHVALAALRFEEAERLYREALDGAPHFGEARLGLGVALASRAAISAEDDRRRALALEAIGQFANVDPADPAYGAALYDRALMLGRVGRRGEAEQALAAELRARPDGAWASRYRRLLGSD